MLMFFSFHDEAAITPFSCDDSVRSAPPSLSGDLFHGPYLLILPDKTKIPSQHTCWDRMLPAVPPGLTRRKARPLFAYRHTRIVVNGEVRSVSHTPACGRFCSPSEVHSVGRIPPRSHLPRLSGGMEEGPTHSSSSVWLHDSTPPPLLSREKFSELKH